MGEIEACFEIGEFEFGRPEKDNPVNESLMDLFLRAINKAEIRKGDRLAINIVAQIVSRGSLEGGLNLDELEALSQVFHDANFTFEWNGIGSGSSNSSE